jgi:hypothetical protein
MASKKAVVFAVTSDHHCGSVVGLCPPEGVRITDDNEYRPGKAQAWIWSCWESYWKDVAERRKALGADLYCAFNGDCVEGTDHHNTWEVISRAPEPQAYVAERVFGLAASPDCGLVVPKADKVFVVRGTEAHVGQGASSEEHLAKKLKAQRHPGGKTWSHYRLRLDIHGVRIDMQHHGRTGTRPWTRTNAPGSLALEIFYEHAARGIPHPHLAIRSHRHTYADSYNAHPTRVIQTPAWQLKTAHAHKVAPESIADIGGLIVTITPDGKYDVEAKLYCPELPSTWKAA